jgi:hypothetical protein
MQYRLTRELGVFVEHVPKLWVPSTFTGLARAPSDLCSHVMDVLAQHFGEQTLGGIVTANDTRLFEVGGRIWHETEPTSVPTLAALYDSTARRLRHELLIWLDDVEDLQIVTNPTVAPPGLMAPPLETYIIPAVDVGKLGEQLLPVGSHFWDRVALPFFAVRRRTIASLGYRQGSDRADEYLVERLLDHAVSAVCGGCAYPCLGLFAYTRHQDGHQIVVNVGDDYAFAHLWSTTLAQTGLFFSAAAAGYLEDINFALAEPLEGFRSLSLLPDTHPVTLRDGGVTTAQEVQEAVFGRVLEFLSTPDHSEATLLMAREIGAIGRWIVGTEG